MSLDDKLTPLLKDYLRDNLSNFSIDSDKIEEYLRFHTPGYTLSVIKQAFADEGYVLDLPKVTDGTLYPLVWAKANGYMTGQEWLTRFELEYDKATNGAKQIVAMQAAKRAANIKERE